MSYNRLLDFITPLVLVLSTSVAAATIINHINSSREAEQHAKKIEAKDKAKELKIESMLLLVSSMQNSSALYEKERNSMKEILSDKEIKLEMPTRVWMLGRMVLAAKMINDQDSTQKLSTTLLQQLQTLSASDDSSPLTGWAWAYLLTAIPDYYQEHVDKLKSYTQDKSEKDYNSTLMWTLVMNLNAAASNTDKETYQYFLTQMINVSPKKTLKSAVDGVPKDDYKYWLLSLLQVSIQLMGDEKNHQDITSLKISESQGTFFDNLLAEAVLLKHGAGFKKPQQSS